LPPRLSREICSFSTVLATLHNPPPEAFARLRSDSRAIPRKGNVMKFMEAREQENPVLSALDIVYSWINDELPIIDTVFPGTPLFRDT